MANAMDETIAKERRKNKKLKQKLSKAKKKLEKQCVDEDEKNDDVKHNFSTLLARCYVVTSFCNI